MVPTKEKQRPKPPLFSRPVVQKERTGIGRKMIRGARVRLRSCQVFYNHPATFRLSSSAVLLEHRQRCRVMIQQDKSAADSATRQQVAAFIFLESPRPPADQETCRFLREMKFLADTTNFLRFKLMVYVAAISIFSMKGRCHFAPR